MLRGLGASLQFVAMPREAASFCRFCIALCGIRVTVEGDTVVSVKGDPDHPASRGITVE